MTALQDRSPQAPPRRTMGASPLRRPASIRRTTSMETHWPDGTDAPLVIDGYGRDVATFDPREPPMLLRENRLRLVVAPDKTLLDIRSEPPLPGLGAMAGRHTVLGYRRALAELVDHSGVADQPLVVLLDDVVGCNIISGWARTKWIAAPAGPPPAGRHPMEGACIGFTPDAESLRPDQPIRTPVTVLPLAHADDPAGFHAVQADRGMRVRRARRLDVWRGAGIEIDSMFQDSGTVPSGLRQAIHEYRVTARLDPGSGRIEALHAEPHTLPHGECIRAPAALDGLHGMAATDLRDHVLRSLRGTLGCTHLNDALRALAEAPLLSAALPHPPRPGMAD